MSAPLIVAVPSKGRLQENVDAFFARAGLKVTRPGGARDYRGRIQNVPDVEIWFLSAGEIARELGQGSVHLGVTGEDLLRETIPEADRVVEPIAPLGFGHADVVVAVPQMWIDVRTMADLDDVAQGFRGRHGRRLRVATKYINLTRSFFAHHMVGDYRIVESLGATEGAPASGAADLIVDITTTGSTLAANALKVLEDGVILKSEATLVAALRAEWSAEQRAALGTLLDRIWAEERARTVREVRALITEDRDRIAEEAKRVFGCEAPEATNGSGPLVLHCAAERIYDLVGLLRKAGAQNVTVTRPDYVFQSDNPLYDRIAARLPR